jgi:hypothetical protein
MQFFENSEEHDSVPRNRRIATDSSIASMYLFD